MAWREWEGIRKAAIASRTRAYREATENSSFNLRGESTPLTNTCLAVNSQALMHQIANCFSQENLQNLIFYSVAVSPSRQQADNFASMSAWRIC